MELSDVISFPYQRMEGLRISLEVVGSYRRPIFCTEWLARHVGSVVEQQLPLFKELKIGAYQWGLVKGKTQTHLPWPFVRNIDPDFRRVWFHDLLEEDGTPLLRQRDGAYPHIDPRITPTGRHRGGALRNPFMS